MPIESQASVCSWAAQTFPPRTDAQLACMANECLGRVLSAWVARPTGDVVGLSAAAAIVLFQLAERRSLTLEAPPHKIDSTPAFLLQSAARSMAIVTGNTIYGGRFDAEVEQTFWMLWALCRCIGADLDKAVDERIANARRGSQQRKAAG